MRNVFAVIIVTLVVLLSGCSNSLAQPAAAPPTTANLTPTSTMSDEELYAWCDGTMDHLNSALDLILKFNENSDGKGYTAQ